MTTVILHLSDIHIRSDRDWIIDKADAIASAVIPALPEASAVFIVVSGDIALRLLTLTAMTPEEKTAKDMIFIAPYEYEGLAGWLVRISWYPDANYEHRKWHSKLFAFRDFESNDDALAAARRYRNGWIEENKGKRYLRSIGARFSPTLPRNNTSGIVGVNRSEKNQKSGALWQTTFPSPTGGVANRKFPISIHGEVGALRLAIQARRAGVLAALGDRNIQPDEAAYASIRFYDDILANLQDLNDQSVDPSVVEIVRNPDIPATTKARTTSE